MGTTTERCSTSLWFVDFKPRTKARQFRINFEDHNRKQAIRKFWSWYILVAVVLSFQEILLLVMSMIKSPLKNLGQLAFGLLNCIDNWIRKYWSA